MAKGRAPRRTPASQSTLPRTTAPPPPPPSALQSQLTSLLNQRKYRQALEAIKAAKRTDPEVVTKPSEAEIWLLRGQHELEQSDFKQAESSFRRALDLGLVGESHYWIARCLLAKNALQEAIALLQPVFENGTLPNQYSICYAKLLLLNGETATVETLLKKSAKRFPAAHRHWLNGVLALKAEQLDAALELFQKVKAPVSAGDRPDIWQVYTHQQLQQWEKAALKLGLGGSSNPFRGPAFAGTAYSKHPVLQQLALLQQVQTGQPPLQRLTSSFSNKELRELVDVIATTELMQEGDFHEAAHALLKLDRQKLQQFPDLANLRQNLLLAAGQQALRQGEINCTVTFWQVVQREQPFNPQLAVNLMRALDEAEDYSDLQKLITQILQWLKQEQKQHPQQWPENRYREAVVYAHCRLADTWMSLGRERTALGELTTAERLDPNSPEVKGRRGLVAAMDGNDAQAIQLMTQALADGCRSREVYDTLIDTLKDRGNAEATLDARRRFGKKFGDLSPEAEVTVVPWVDALSTKSYPLFSSLLSTHRDASPPMQACRIFVQCTQGDLTASSGKISLKQANATQQWDALLERISPQEQVPTLQAIGLCIHLFAKREKGIADLGSRYMLQLANLQSQRPEAKPAHLVILALRDPKKIPMALPFYLARQPQPGNALARIQLDLRRYAQTPEQRTVFRPALQEALQREPQNPLLLLAMATTYPAQQRDYENLYQQGFEIARRIQDAKALQAFREEQAFLNAQSAQDFLPDFDRLGDLDEGGMDQLLEAMIRKMLGNQIPASELKRALPELKRLLETMPTFDNGDFDDDDDGGGFGFPFGFPFGPKPKGRKKRR
jgi:tetratricopeptide (TPR) repeat protein